MTAGPAPHSSLLFQIAWFHASYFSAALTAIHPVRKANIPSRPQHAIQVLRRKRKPLWMIWWMMIVVPPGGPQVLDSALLRPGRFDRRVSVERPDRLGREQILRVHIERRQLPLADDVCIAEVASSTVGFTGADLANLVNEAALLAGRESKRAPLYLPQSIQGLVPGNLFLLLQTM